MIVSYLLHVLLLLSAARGDVEETIEAAAVEVQPVAHLESGEWIHALDEKLTPEQHDRIFVHPHNLTIRAAITRRGRWPNAVVPYAFRSFGRTKLVYSAMRELQEGSCLKFKKREAEKNYVLFTNDDGCSSQLGMTGGRQRLSLNSRGCLYRDTVLHEILHALGIIHEQERPDRDEHIDVKWDNMKPGNSGAYDLTSNNEIRFYGVPYDFASIMHYSLRSFSKDRKKLYAMEPRTQKHAYEYVERARDYGLSFDDFKILNRAYDCGAHCKPGTCKEPGYLTKDCECMTKPKFYEKHCKGEEKAGWCVKFKLQGDVDDSIGPDAAVTTTTTTTEGPEDPNCRDAFDSCIRFAKTGYCEPEHANYDFVKTRCAKSCKFC